MKILSLLIVDMANLCSVGFIGAIFIGLLHILLSLLILSLPFKSSALVPNRYGPGLW